MRPTTFLAACSTVVLLGACQSQPAEQADTTNAQTTTATKTNCPPAPAAYTIRHPDWAASASIYEVNVRQYTPEGTFRAFEQHLPRLQKMGVGILWLMPVNPIGREKRKGTLGSYYSVQDYRAVNPEMGSLADLKHLVDEAHRRGMHVILDWVANHTSWDSKLAREHPDWFTKDAQGRFVAPVSDWQDVIDLDFSKPELRRYMTESMAYWVREAGVDGFRCDVAGLVPTDFWNATRAELEKIKPVFMLAEWDELHAPPFLRPGEFDPNTRLLEQAFDATYGLRLRYLLDSVARGQQPVAAVDKYLRVERARYPRTTYLMNFTSSHDINSWTGTEYERLGPNVQPQAVLAALLPGIPMLYSGQESALKRRLKFFDKDPIAWGNYPLQDFYTRLLQLKKRHPALRNGDACGQLTRLPSPPAVYAFVRHLGPKAVLVAVNLGAQLQELPIPAAWQGDYQDVFADQPYMLAPGATLPVDPHGYRVLELTRKL
jgi:glycosidase